MHNHYLPQHYLKGFVNSNTGLICRYSRSQKVPLQTGVAAVANEKGYWSDDFEKFLNENVEKPAQAAIDRIRMGSTPTRHERWLLSRYMISMLRRVPAAQQELYSRGPEHLRGFIDRQIEEIENNLLHEPRPEYEDKLAFLRNLPDGFFTEIPVSMWETLVLPETSPDGLNAISNMRWVFLKAPWEQELVTSDNPFVYTKRNGVKPPNGEFIFPISSRIALWGTWDPQRKDGSWISDRRLIGAVNHQVVSQTTQYIYCSSPSWENEKLLSLIRK